MFWIYNDIGCSKNASLKSKNKVYLINLTSLINYYVVKYVITGNVNHLIYNQLHRYN